MMMKISTSISISISISLTPKDTSMLGGKTRLKRLTPILQGVSCLKDLIHDIRP
jgi:hypothetical protein